MAAAGTTGAPPERARILVVDDVAENVTLLRRVLTDAGYDDLHEAGDADGLPSLLTSLGPDLLLLDWHLPGMAGEDVLHQLRVDDRWADLPVIVVTADPRARLRALELGATDFLTKPFDHPEIVLRVRNALRTRQLHQELRAQKDWLERRVQGRTIELREANEKLREAEVVRRDFIAMASHEMRTPLTVIRGFLDVWASRGIPTSGTIEDQLDAIRRNVRRMEHLVHNLLLASRVETGAEGHRRRTFEFARLLESSELTVGAVQAVHVDNQVSGRFEGDAELLALVLANLVSNADRYGEPPIEVRAAPVPGGVEVRVVDHGPGVPRDFAPRLFDRFSQASIGDRRTSRGTGLGLWVSQHIVAMHGGRLWHEPTPGGGATFVLRLPDPDHR